MTTLTTIGNLTRDAEIKTSKEGKEYLLLNVAENIYKRNEDGTIARDENDHYITLQTMFYSVFIYRKVDQKLVSKLAKGQAVKIKGKANIRIEKDANNYNQYIIDSITARNIDCIIL